MEVFTIAFLVAVMVMIVTAVIAFRRMFRGFDDFVECNRMAHQPMWISWWRGKAAKDELATRRLGAWLAIILFHGFTALCLTGFIVSVVAYVSKHPEMPTYKAPETAIPIRSLHR